MSTSTYRPDIDGLRALAILPVVAFHAFPGKLPGGFAGVDVFFVISGFLISGILQRSLAAGQFSLGDFYARRLRRIGPALLLVLASCLTLGWWNLLPAEYQQLTRHVAGGVGFVQNFVLWHEASYFDSRTLLKPLMHLWSLSIEEQFYLCYPLLLWGLWRWKKDPALWLAVLAGLSFAAGLWSAAHDPMAGFFAPWTRAWELLAGAWLATRAPLGSRQDGASLAGLALLLASFFLLNEQRAHPGWQALLPVAGTMLLLAAGPQALANRRVLAVRALIGIGLISYPLYLWHWPLLAFGRISDGLPPIERNLAVLASFVLAWLTWRLVERPLRAGPQAGLKAVLLAVLLAVLGTLAWLAPAQNAAPHQAMQRYLQANVDNALQPQSCAGLTGRADPEDWCHPGNAGGAAPDTVLIGDSFATAYVEMLSAHGASRFVQWGRGHCPGLIDYGPAYCRAIVAAQSSRLAALPEVHTVVLAAHWTVYDAGMHWPRHGEQASQADFRQALKRTLAHYQGMGKRVLVLLAPPTGANPAVCVPRPLHGVTRELCERSTTEARSSDGGYREAMLPLLAAHGIASFDPFPWLCDAQHCRLREGERMLYADWLHLSRHGGRYLAAQGASRLDALFAAPAAR